MSGFSLRETGTMVEVLGDAAGLRALVPEWEALAAEAAEPNPFYEHWMLIPALEAYGARDFRCVAVWDDGTLAALFPMRLERRWRHLPFSALRSYRHRNMLYCAPLVRRKSVAKCIAALLAQRLAPVVEFDWITAGGAFFRGLVEALHEVGQPWMVTDAYVRALLTRESDPRECFSSNMKNNLRRWQAKLVPLGSLEPVRLQPGDDSGAWMKAFMDLEARGWKGRAGTALACREDDRRFIGAVMGEAVARGRLHISGLDLAGQPLARHIMFSAGDRAFSFKLAYDETHAKASPGILAEVENVRQFMETPALRWIDSNTARQSTGYWRVWKEGHTVQRVAVAAGAAGAAALAGLGLVRMAKSWLKRKTG